MFDGNFGRPATEMVIQQGIFDGHLNKIGRFMRPYYDLARPRKG